MHKLFTMPSAETALPGREEPMPISGIHYVNGHSIKPPFRKELALAQVGMGCFWGAERCFWQMPGVYSTAVGYSAGYTPNPSYQEVCSGLTGHNEVVLIVYDPVLLDYQKILTTFWQSHNPTQVMAQGNDQGTQYRSGIYVYSEEQMAQAQASKLIYQQNLTDAGYGDVSSEIIPASEFYYAEEYHQQYLAKNPQGYCGLGGTGVVYKAE